jgi:hypothetical protein
MKQTKRLLLALVILTSLPSFSQESIIKDFAEDGRRRWNYPIALYASTLRMANLSGDPQFNALVNDIDKILIYSLDSTNLTSPKINTWMKEYEAIGYEEYIMISGLQHMRIIGKGDEYVGLFGTNDKKMAFYLRGEIGFEKIPKLIQTFQSNDMLSVLTDQFK